ncbi:TPA: hypothetical protein ACPTOS_003902 [Escherichia coli]
MLGIKPMSVSRWKNRYQGVVPADRVLQIYAANWYINNINFVTQKLNAWNCLCLFRLNSISETLITRWFLNGGWSAYSAFARTLKCCQH